VRVKGAREVLGIITDNLSKTDWNCGWTSAVHCDREHNLDCQCSPRRRKVSRCARGWKADYL